MEDGDVKMTESVAIMTYILERHGVSFLASAYHNCALGN